MRGKRRIVEECGQQDNWRMPIEIEQKEGGVRDPEAVPRKKRAVGIVGGI